MAATRSGNPAVRNAKKVADAKAQAKAEKNVFDLDTLTREELGIEVKEPMVAKIKGVTFTMSDPGDLDFTEISTLRETAEGMRALFQHVIGEAIFDKIMDPATGPVDQWKIWALMEHWTQHYEFRLRAAPENGASPQL